jgi:omega-6 fatty acid desaturase (delta-12 desaturase)
MACKTPVIQTAVDRSISSKTTSPAPTIEPSWKQSIAKHNRPSVGRSIWQLINTLGPYAALWALMVWLSPISIWLTLPLIVVAAGLLVRIFIIFHDCTHGSFFRSRSANNATGFITGVLTFTSYHQWRYQHAQHHRTSGDLDRRGIGDVPTMTVQEYLAASRWDRLKYRFVRNPIVLLVVGPTFMFLIHHRFPAPEVPKRISRHVHATNLAILALGVFMSLLIGFKTYLLIQIPILALTTCVGHWLFYIQHQFEGVYWERQENWNFVDAALRGSSYYKLPKILQWFSGNICFHHLHHLSPAIPNYYLSRCHADHPAFQQVTTINLWTSLKSLSLRLWDEQGQRLIGYRELRTIRMGLTGA